MAFPYQHWDKSESALLKGAAQIYAERHRPCRLAPLVIMTDPSVHDDVCALAMGAPKGAAIIYRHFGADDREGTADKLRHITFARAQQFLIGDDPMLAINCGADGVHFRRDEAVEAPTLWRARCPDWIITMAGIKGAGIQDDYVDYSGDLSVLDGLFVSCIFHSESQSAGKPIGTARLLGICAVLGAPIVALGGVNARTIDALTGSGVAGIAGRFVF